jgi:hypothetical protein
VHPIADTADIVAFIAEAAPVQQILNHTGQLAEPPWIAPPADRLPGTTRRSISYRQGLPQ